MRDDAGQGGSALPPDLQIDPTAAAASAASTSANSYTKTIKLPIVIGKTYKFWFKYLYEDTDTKIITESESSPIFRTTFNVPNLTKGVLNLTLTPGYKSYGVKFTIDPTSVQEDIVIYESLSSSSLGNEVYRGTSTNVTIPTNSIATRWITVRTRDKWVDTNVTDTGPLSVTPMNPDPDTSTAPSAPTGVTANGSIDPDDKSGFSGQLDVNWTANTDANTAGYVIRWSTQNPVTTQNPVWEYGQVEGKSTTRFTVTGLLPKTLYYYQVTSKSPYNALSWSSPQSGTFGPINDPNAPDDVWAQLRSILSIGGKTADLFKIGTGIAQSINTSTTTTQNMVSGTYSGVILNKSTTNYGHNYWLNTGQFRVGSSSAFLYWDGSDLYTTGKINATGGSFTGDVKLDGGTLFAGSAANSGQRVRLNSSGIFAYNSGGTQTFSLDTAGYVNATTGLIGGWNLGTTTLSANSVVLNSAGQISLGGSPSTSVYLSSTDTARIWVGSQASSGAKFRVDADGTLRATGAVIGLGAGSTIDGYATTTALGSYTLTSVTTGINSRLTTAEGTITSHGTTLSTQASSISTLSTGLSTKNSTFVTTDNTAPSATKIGDLWINGGDNNEIYTAGAVGTGSWTKKTNGAYAKTTDLNSKLNASSYVVQNSVDNSISMNTNGISVFSGANSNNGSNSGITFNSAGIAAWKAGNPTFSILTDGTATFYGTLSAATGSFSGAVTATTGAVGGFGLSGGDLTANFNVGPRIMFGSKIQLGWESGYPFASSNVHSLIIGSNSGDQGKQFYVNTNSDVFRFAADSSARAYAGEVRNTLRAANLRYTVALYNDSSSRRFKENITYLPETYYKKILNVKPAFYTYIDNHPETDSSLWGTHAMGPIAEDLEEAGLGFFVERNLDGNPTALRNEHKLVFLLIPLVKDMKNQIDSLQIRLTELENTNV